MVDTMGLMTQGARTLETQEEPEGNRFLTFLLGHEVFAMDIRAIREVIQYPDITEVPLVSRSVRGVINLRGSVVPVIDLAVRLGWAPGEVARRTCVVVLELGEGHAHSTLGIVVDAVREVLEIPPEEIEPAPAFGNKLRPDFIRGVGKVKGQFLMLLNASRVLSVEELASKNG